MKTKWQSGGLFRPVPRAADMNFPALGNRRVKRPPGPGCLPFRLWPYAAVFALLLVIVFALCSGCYTLKQGTALLGYMGKAVPLDDLAGEGASEEDRIFAARVADIRLFAMEKLGLKESKNYTSYVALDRDYLAAVVSACAADSFTRYEWRFPVVGTVPYKGFFDPEDAKKEGGRLKARGFDVWIREVDAFSTLGWFRDPLYSYMKDYSDYNLANLIIHELLHATVFIKGQVQFNEQLAEFTGTSGAKLYIESRFGTGSVEYRNIGAGTADGALFREWTNSLIAELSALYASNLGKKEKLAEKQAIIRAAQERFDAEYRDRFQNKSYGNFSRLPVNNAFLDLYRLYESEDTFFADLYEKIPVPDNAAPAGIARLRAFITAASALNNSRAAKKNPRKEFESTVKKL